MADQEQVQTTPPEGLTEDGAGPAEPRRTQPAGRHAGRTRRRSVERDRRRTWDEEDSDRIVDESTRFARALTLGYLRQIELLADVAGTFATSVIDSERDGERDRGPRRRSRRDEVDARYDVDDVLDLDDDFDLDDDLDLDDEPRGRRRTGSRRSSRGRRGPRYASDTFSDLAEDMYDGIVDAFRDLTDIPERVVDEFYDTYDDDDRPRRRRRSRARAR